MAEKSQPGGSRSGAGRPNGSKNKASAAREKKIAASGLTPLEFMLKCMRGEKIRVEGSSGSKLPRSQGYMYPNFEDMKWGAAGAAPYVHPRLASVQHTGDEGGPIRHEHGLTPEVMALIDKIAGDTPR